mgnify:CR=1 FL=1
MYIRGRSGTECSCQAGGVHTWDGNGLCLFTKRLDQGGFVWPQADDPGGQVVLSPAQLSMLFESIDWRAQERMWRPQRAG